MRVDFYQLGAAQPDGVIASIAGTLLDDEQRLLLRYNSPDGFDSPEGAFLPCTFWLVSCLAHQGKLELAEEDYQRALACANVLGLFSEEYDVKSATMLGNFPQTLTHVSQITALQSLLCARNHCNSGD